jgi:hypothetical protein
MHAAKAVTTLGGAVVGRAACGAGAGDPCAGLPERRGSGDGGEGVAVPSGAAEPGEAEPDEGELAEAGGEVGVCRPPVPSPFPPQPAVSARVAASSSAAGLVRDIGST